METNTTQISDRNLVVKCQSGDKQAFELLAKRYYQKAFGMAIYWIHNREAALDISQEAFVRIYRNINRFHPERSFSAWMYTIIKNLCRNYSQRQQKRWTVFSDHISPNEQGQSDAAEIFSALEYEDETVERNERHKLIWNALNKLPEADREVIILKDMEEFSYKEISETLEIPLGSVMSRLYYARKKLASLVKVEIE